MLSLHHCSLQFAARSPPPTLSVSWGLLHFNELRNCAAEGDGEEGEDGGGDEDCGAEFKPLVQLDEVEVQVGDLNTGPGPISYSLA